MNRIERKFKILKSQKKSAFIVFITAGFPDLTMTERLVKGLDKCGVDIIELGMPFSDPLADGPLIQQSSSFSLKKGTSLNRVLLTIKRIRKSVQVPLCLMSYYNPILAMGEEKFLRHATDCGVDGIIVPDLPPEEASVLIKYARRYGLCTIFFLSPTSSIERIKRIAKFSSGFIYYVSLTGTTGIKRELNRDLRSRIRLIKRYTKLPVCVGFGVSKREHIRQIKKIADGVIVGSAVIDKIRRNFKRPDMVKKVLNFVSTLNA